MNGAIAEPASFSFGRTGFLIAALFGLSLVLAETGFAGTLRAVFPIVAMILGAWLLANGQREDYLTLVLWLFLLTPGLRRLVDFHAGWTLVNPIMMAPYATAVLSVGPVFRSLSKQYFPYSGLFALLFVCVGYGLLLAVVYNRPFAAIFDALRWAVPPCFCLFIALDQNGQLAHQRAVTRTMLLAMVGLSLYGIYQYVAMPSWDAYWMRNSGMGSIGQPQPFQVRVFSTMNSPGSFSAYLMAGLLLALPARGVLRLPAIASGATALLLSLVRTSWLGLTVGLIFLLLFGRSIRARFSIMVGLICLPIVLMAIGKLPGSDQLIGKRIGTVSTLQSDESFNARGAGYRDFFSRDLGENPLGSGLGVAGRYQSYLDHRHAKYIDGAVIEIGTALGILGGGVYLIVSLITAAIACWRSLLSADPFCSSCGAIVAAQTIGLIGGSMTIGELGMLFWIAAGFCLAPHSSGVPDSRRGFAVQMPTGAMAGVREDT